MIQDQAFAEPDFSEDDLHRHFESFVEKKSPDTIDIGREGARIFDLMTDSVTEDGSCLADLMYAIACAAERAVYADIAKAHGVTIDVVELALDTDEECTTRDLCFASLPDRLASSVKLMEELNKKYPNRP